MTGAMAHANPALRKPAGGSGLYDVLELILDKGLVIDAYVRVSLVGIELLTVDLRVVVASVDTYLRWAEAAERLVLRSEPRDVGDLVGSSRSGRAMEKAAEALTPGESKGGGIISKITGSEGKKEKQEK